MYVSFEHHLEEMRTLLGADRLCFWRRGYDGAAWPQACVPSHWLEHAFAARSSPQAVELFTGADARRQLPMGARQTLPRDFTRAAVAHLQRDPASGLFAYWRDADSVPADLPRLGALIALNWSMTVQGQSKIDHVTSASMQLGRLVAALPQGVAVVVPSGRPSLINAPAARWLELPPGTAESATVAEALHRWVSRAVNHDAIRESVGAMLSDNRGQAGSVQLEFDAPHSMVQVTIAPIGEGSAEGWVWLMQDVTTEHQGALDLHQALAGAAQANAAKSAFLATMSHELRTPLNAVLGFSRLLEDSLIDGEAQRQARFIRETGETLNTILNDILDIAKIEAGKFDLDPRPFRMEQVFESCASIFRVVAAQRGIDFSMDLPQNLPSLVGDPVRLRQIVHNLLANAFKFTSSGHVQVKLKVTGEPCLAQGRRAVRLQLQVIDSGIGMTPDQLGRLFQRFEQAEQSTATRFGGTGLGLAIVKALTEMMNGEVTVTSTFGQGTTFTLTLAFELSQVEATGALALATTPTEQPLRVLVVDDFHINRIVIRALLERRGHTVTEAQDGVEAITQVAAVLPDLVLMDIDMPHLDGLQATRHLRAQMGPGQYTPIYALTGKAFAEDIARTRDAGMDGHLAKPVHLEELVKVLQQVGSRTA